MAVTRPCIEAIGGFAALADYLADDYYLGNLAARAGYQVRILPYVVETYPDVDSLRGLFHHQLRCLELLEAQFRMLVNLSAVGHHFGFEILGFLQHDWVCSL